MTPFCEPIWEAIAASRAEQYRSDQSSPEEVEAVLAHELGHWKFNHSLRMMGLSQIITLVNLLMLRISIFNPALVGLIYRSVKQRLMSVLQYRSFNFYNERPVIIGLLVSMSLLTPLDTIISFIINAVSRRFEFQADLFAFNLSNSEHEYADKLKKALVRLGNENKSVTDVDSLWSAYKHSHPVCIHRIVLLDY
jgi:STE24 endopeptidase